MSDTQPVPPQQVHWIDMIVRDPDTVSRFYTDVIGLQRVAVPEDNTHTSYALQDATGKDVLGICDEAMFSNWPGGWVPYIDVPDFDQSVSKVVQSGGQIVKQLQMDFNWKGQRFCLARDPSGAPVMLCEAKPK